MSREAVGFRRTVGKVRHHTLYELLRILICLGLLFCSSVVLVEPPLWHHGHRFSYRSWGTGQACLACVQEVRDAVTTFRYGRGHVNTGATSGDGADAAGSTPVDGGEGGQQRRKFTVAVADTFGESGPVREL